jgi:hypothetical protein
MNGTRVLFVISAALAVGVACGGSVNPAGDDAGSDDGGGFIPTGDDGSNGGSSSSGSSGGGNGTCVSTCTANRDCVSSCGMAQAGLLWCCSNASACYQAAGAACPTSPDAGRGGGAGSGMTCTNTAGCTGGMRCCAGFTGRATCQSSCPGGVEACQKNSDCSGGMCVTLMGPGICLGGGPVFDAGTRG